MLKLGVIACDMIRRELDKLLSNMFIEVETLYIESALHCNPNKMRKRIEEAISEMADHVDVIFLGYGYCNSLKGIDEQFKLPVILPQVDDCISLLLGPERRAEEVKCEVGTWFMTPGWAEVGAEMVIKELHLDRVARYGKDPIEMAKRLFTHYRRGLLIDTGLGDMDDSRRKAAEFCRLFNLRLEETSATPVTLAMWLAQGLKRIQD